MVKWGAPFKTHKQWYFVQQTFENNYFVTKVRNLRNNLPASRGNPLSKDDELMRNRSCNFKFRAVHPDEISKIISNLKTTISCGLDDIDSYVIKLAKEELTPAITHIVNLSLQTETFPTIWKKAKVIPLHKKKEVILPENYRPVALLSVLSKILERSVFLQLIQYFESNNLIHPSHHGFRSKHNTSTALLQMYNEWEEPLDDGKLVQL